MRVSTLFKNLRPYRDQDFLKEVVRYYHGMMVWAHFPRPVRLSKSSYGTLNNSIPANDLSGRAIIGEGLVYRRGSMQLKKMMLRLLKPKQEKGLKIGEWSIPESC